MNKDWGVVQHFELEADTKTAMLNALSVLMTEHSRLCGYEEFLVKDIPTLAIYWTDSIAGMSKFIVDVTSGEHIADTLLVWTKERCAATREPNIDGSCRKGYRIFRSLREPKQNASYVAFYIQPCWIEYHK